MKKTNSFTMDRRKFIKRSAAGLASLPAVGLMPFGLNAIEKTQKVKIALVKTGDRAKGVSQALKLLQFPPMKNKRVFVKPNFNTADPTPGSTHNDTLSRLIHELQERGAKEITVGDRSGPANTKKVMEDKGVFDMAQKLGFKLINFDELADKDWLHFNPSGNHWSKGFHLARPVVDTEYAVSTYCLKTHQYGGVFTMALKLTVGSAPKKLMRELHTSPNMRKMIAELNLGYKPQLLVMDGVEAFVDGGPMTGTLKKANVVAAGCDPVAMDALGIAVLKELGSNDAIMGRKIFEQEQIKRAVELGLGIDSPDRIDFVTADKESADYAKRLKAILAKG
jgi:uncharacterized protein (DUF362 family)